MKDYGNRKNGKYLESINGKAVIFTLGNGIKVNLMEKEIIYGMMEIIIKVNTNKINKKEMDNTFIMMEKSIQGNGLMVKSMEKENILIKMAILFKKETGSIIFIKNEF